MNTHERLVAARNTIDSRGWWQGWWGIADDGSGPGGQAVGTCVSNACAAVGDEDRQARSVLAGLIQPGAGEAVHRMGGLDVVYAWNDAPDRTKDEVLALFDAAIAATAPTPDVSFLAREAVRV